MLRFVLIIIDLLTNLLYSLSVLSKPEIAEMGGPVRVESYKRETIRGREKPSYVYNRGDCLF
jgi:hypothetical protein